MNEPNRPTGTAAVVRGDRPWESVRVELGPRSYDILVGPHLLGAAGHLIEPVLQQKRAFIVTDETVAQHHLDALRAALREAGIAFQISVVAPGEGSKSFEALESVIDDMLGTRIERRSAVIAFGGGVIGDLAGFAASAVLRGVDLVQLPTTLLAQVDSSVGGKTGINTPRGKNLVGSFHQPRLVLADTTVLDTLSRRELLAGYAEVVKYGLIGDAGFFGWLEENGANVIAGDHAPRRHAVLTTCAAKAAIVAADELETGQRQLLNLGHTFAHALEAEFGYRSELLHGEAVSVGMVLAFALSARLGYGSEAETERVKRHLAEVGLPVGLSGLDAKRLDPARLMDHMRHDKKVRDGTVAFVLARGIGRAFVAPNVPEAAVIELLAAACRAA